MTTGTSNGQAKKYLGSDRDYIVQFLVAVFFERLVTNGGAIAAKARCHPGGKVIAVDFVSRQLLADKSIIGLVLVETGNHVVPVMPGMGPHEIKFKTVGIRVAGQVEPVSAPAFSIPGRGQ